MNHNSDSDNRDDKGVGMAREIISPKNQLNLPKHAVRSTRNAVTIKFKRKLLINGIFY